MTYFALHRFLSKQIISGMMDKAFNKTQNTLKAQVQIPKKCNSLRSREH